MRETKRGGRPLGRHQGIYRYTVGQRRPGLFEGRKLYVSRIEPESNVVELALWEELFKSEVFARDFSWLIEPPSAPIRASVRVRHTKWENPDCTVYPEGERLRILAENMGFRCEVLGESRCRVFMHPLDPEREREEIGPEVFRSGVTCCTCSSARASRRAYRA